jgi:Predicted nucleic acid-binding protein, contains PIN domain
VRPVFVDTSALIALLDRADPRHEAVRSTFLELADRELVTHGYVVAETLAVARRRFGVDGVIALLDDLLPVLTVLPVEPSLHASAQTRYRASLPSGTSFVDQVSFGVMTQEAIDTAFALDADFVAAGVDVIPA